MCYMFCLCLGGPSGFGLLADWSLSPGGGDSSGAAASREGGCGGMPVTIDAAGCHRRAPTYMNCRDQPCVSILQRGHSQI